MMISFQLKKKSKKHWKNLILHSNSPKLGPYLVPARNLGRLQRQRYLLVVRAVAVERRRVRTVPVLVAVPAGSRREVHLALQHRLLARERVSGGRAGTLAGQLRHRRAAAYAGARRLVLAQVEAGRPVQAGVLRADARVARGGVDGGGGRGRGPGVVRRGRGGGGILWRLDGERNKNVKCQCEFKTSRLLSNYTVCARLYVEFQNASNPSQLIIFGGFQITKY